MWHTYLLNLFILILNLQQKTLVLSQLVRPDYLNLEFKNKISDCNAGEFYDINQLVCKLCPPDTVSFDKYNCKCKNEFKFKTNNGGDQIECIKCPDGFIQSLDGFECVKCDSECLNCPAGSYRSDREQDGTYYTNYESKCIKCNENSTQLNSNCFSNVSLDLNNNPLMNTIDVVTSLCENNNLQACQYLINKCVLSLYDPNEDSCSNYDVLFRKNNTSLPWIYYNSNDYFDEYLIFDQELIKLKYDSKSKCKPRDLTFYLAEYKENGILNDFNKLVDFGKLQFCDIRSNINIFSMIDLYKKCNFDINTIKYKETLFYELYLGYRTFNQTETMLNIPIQIDNKLYRRFFLFDFTTKNRIKYAKLIKFQFELISGKNEGEIYPPVVKIDYLSENDEKISYESIFQVEYKMDISLQRKYMLIAVGVLSGLAFLVACFRIYIWNRRSIRYMIDVIFMFKFLMYLIGYVGNAMLIVQVAISIYWFIFYRAQQLAFVFLPSENDEKLFNTFIFISFGLKLVEILYMIFEQTSFDIFFIDWERPLNSSKKIEDDLISKNSLSKIDMTLQNQVSCWRTLFVANEWNEIQTYRKINRSFQLLLVLFLLKVINLEELALKQCEVGLEIDQNEFKSSYSVLLRVSMAGSVFLAVGLLQWFFHTFLYKRCFEDKLSNFVDFCSVSNISMFIITHSQFGYYIHGRSPTGNSDISMQKMTEALLNEENNMTTRRGLEDGSDHQSFTISVTNKLTKQYLKVMQPLNQIKMRNLINSANRAGEFEKRMIAYTQLNRFFVAFINNVLRDMKYIVVKRNLIESLLDFEFKIPFTDSYFYPDDISCFSRTIFYGNEIKLFMFDLVLFLFVDIIAKNYVLAAIIVYVVTRIFESLRSDLGKRNLSRKTLVDKRFLI